MKRYLLILLIGIGLSTVFLGPKAHVYAAGAGCDFTPPSSYSNGVKYMANMDNYYAGEPKFNAPDEVKSCAENAWIINNYSTIISTNPLPLDAQVYGNNAIVQMMEIITVGKNVPKNSFNSVMLEYVGSDVFDVDDNMVASNVVTFSRGKTSFSKPLDPDHSKGNTQNITINTDPIPGYGYFWICVKFNMSGTYGDDKPWTSPDNPGRWCTRVQKVRPPPSAPVITQFCSGNKVQAKIEWPAGNPDVVRYSVQIDNNPFVNGEPYWYKGPIPAGTRTINDAPSGFVPFDGAVGPLVFNPGDTYYVRIVYDLPPGDWSDFYFGQVAPPMKARLDCVSPTPPAPTVTPTCTNNNPSASISWNAVSGLAPTNFTVDLDNDNFSGGWLYRNVSSSGPGPYSTTAPDNFNPYGSSSPPIPLSANTTYQVRINYRAAFAGADVQSLVQTFTTRGDCTPVTPPAPVITQSCNGSSVQAKVEWQAGGLSASEYWVDADYDNNWGNGYWHRGPIPAGTLSIPDAPNSFTNVNSTGTLVFNGNSNYQIRIWYNTGAAGILSNVANFTARNDCTPPPPPAPTVTPTCSSGRPTVDISWNAVTGLSPSGFTVDLDNDNFAGGWLYMDASSAGPSPYTVKNAPNGFGSIGSSPPAVPLLPGAAYQARVNYRQSSGGADVLSLVGSVVMRTDCGPPPSPTITNTCSGTNPSITISWNAGGWQGGSGFNFDITDQPAGSPDFGSPEKGWTTFYAAGATSPQAITTFAGNFGGTSGPLTVTRGKTYMLRAYYPASGNHSALPNPIISVPATACLPPPLVTCTNVNPFETEPGSPPFALAVSYRNSAGHDSLVSTSVDVSVAGQTANTGFGPTNPLPGDGSTINTASMTFDPATISPGTYEVTLRFNGGNAPAGWISCNPIRLSVAKHPYFRAFGGDVVAGSYAGCMPWEPHSSSSGGILGFNSGAGKGAGTQLYAQALNTIYGFSSAQTSNPAADKGLTYANSGADTFGGNSRQGSCPPDYFANRAPATGGVPPLAYTTATPSGIYYSSGSLLSTPISGGIIGQGKSIVIYVDGDVYITGNITYDDNAGTPGYWSNAEDIPSFVLVAKGNITIAPSVTKLEGVYIAQPVDGITGGTIYTCDTVLPRLSLNDIASQCDDNLTIIGSVAARHIKLLRMAGTAREASANNCPADMAVPGIYGCSGVSTAAEQFIYSPQVWLRSNNIIGVQKSSNFDVFTIVPPIL